VPEGDHAVCNGETPPPCRPHVVQALAEQLKVAVSGAETASRTCAALTDGACAPLELTLTKRGFETTCAYLFDRATSTVAKTLEDGMLTTKDVDEVVLVGGTSRIPRVRELLKTHLGVSYLNTDIDPDVTVAVGAASILD